MSVSCQQVFKFKQFKVCQNQQVMKVGTDGVLLGAWAHNNPINRILDVGTGTGLIALMLAQKFQKALIDAIDINPYAVRLAQSNFLRSPWHNRLQAYLTDFNRFTTKVKYDLIVSNPPYFDENILAKNKYRNKARHTGSLLTEQLIKKAAELLQPYGSIQLILPYAKTELIQNISKDNNLYINKLTNVKGNKNTEFKRILVKLSFEKKSPTDINHLVIEKQRHVYTDSYIKLTRDFYLKM